MKLSHTILIAAAAALSTARPVWGASGSYSGSVAGSASGTIHGDGHDIVEPEPRPYVEPTGVDAQHLEGGRYVEGAHHSEDDGYLKGGQYVSGGSVSNYPRQLPGQGGGGGLGAGPGHAGSGAPGGEGGRSAFGESGSGGSGGSGGDYTNDESRRTSTRIGPAKDGLWIQNK